MNATSSRGCSSPDAPSARLPDGWAGKPHACHVGAAATVAELLVFIDADVTPAPDLLHRIARVLADTPDALVSVQPWHLPGRGRRHAAEHLQQPVEGVHRGSLSRRAGR